MPRRFLKTIATVALCLLSLSLLHAQTTQAQDRVWSAMIFATNTDAGKPVPPELANFRGQLEDIFGYKVFEVIDSHTELMDDPTERWLLPSKHFSLSVAATPAGKSLYDVKLSLFH